MKARRRAALGAAFLLLGWTASVAVKESRQLAEARRVADAMPGRFRKVLVLGISDVPDVRNRFEDKFVTQLRARGIEATTSHSLVPYLAATPARDRILAALGEEGVDGTITVRAVPLSDLPEEAWAEAWTAWSAAAAPTVRDLVRDTIPVPEKAAKIYGVEFAAWEVGSGRLLWTARSGRFPLKKLRAAVTPLLAAVMNELQDLGVI